MSLLSRTLLIGEKLLKSPLPQDSGKGPVIGNIFSTTSPSVSLDKTESDMSNMDDNLNSEAAVRHIHGMEAGKASGLDVIEPKPMYAGPANYIMDIFNDTSNSSFGLLDGINNYSFLLDCDNSSDPTSMCVFNNVSSPTTTTPEDLPEHTYWSLFLLIFPFLTVFGNVLVVLSIYRERSLRHVTNYFICSLAIADILVAVIVMPPAVFMEVSGLNTIFVSPLFSPLQNDKSLF